MTEDELRAQCADFNDLATGQSSSGPTIEELRAYCAEHGACIYVRVAENKRLVPKAFAELEEAAQKHWIEDWSERGIYPFRKLSDAIGN